MNLESMPSTQFKLDQNGYLSVEWQNFFSMNAQSMETFFSNTGHLVPSHSDANVQAFNAASLSDPTVLKARSLYNNDTGNLMGNINGQYLNYTMNEITTRAGYLSMTPYPTSIQFYGDEMQNVYVTVSSIKGQIPKNTTVTGVLNFSLDGLNNQFSTINGITTQVLKNTTPGTDLISFSGDGGGNLFVTINGVTKQVVLL